MPNRYILAAVLFLTATVFTILTCRPHSATASWPITRQGKSLINTIVPITFGKHRRPKLGHLTLTANLPREYLPTIHNNRRIIIIGDIHGMNAELGELLDAAHYDSSHDHVVTLGDMVNKGPDSKGVLARLMAMNASAVRGNHEDHLLSALQEYNSRVAPPRDDDSSEVTNMRKRNEKILKVAKTLLPEQVEWLSNLPVILKAKPLKLYFVHGGLVPGLQLEKQDPWAVMNMRTLVYPKEELRRSTEGASDLDSHFENDEEHLGVDADKVNAIPINDHSGERWTKAWNRYMRHQVKPARRTVMYGHDSKRGFSEGRYTVGLDSGCVRGGSLTGLIVEAVRKRGFRYMKVAIPCKKAMKAIEQDEA